MSSLNVFLCTILLGCAPLPVRHPPPELDPASPAAPQSTPPAPESFLQAARLLEAQPPAVPGGSSPVPPQAPPKGEMKPNGGTAMPGMDMPGMRMPATDGGER
ncbi:MAG: hypothetical protein ACYCWW_17755 [Deltaproteobacteria bacterium]